MHQQGRLVNLSQLEKYLTNLISFLSTKKPYDFSEKCKDNNDYSKLILPKKNIPPQ